MSVMVRVTLADGTERVMDLEDAQALKESGELIDPDEDDDTALTLGDFYGGD